MRYFEDLHAGDAFTSPVRTVSAAEIVAFARDFDPQPFHLDPEAAAASFFGGLVASGWHTSALTMRLMTESGMDLAGGIIGLGMEQLRWPAPLRPDQSIQTRIEVLDVRGSERRPQFGVVRFRIETRCVDGPVVFEMTGSLIVPRRPAG
jgi:acyl dehydratase